MAARSVTWLHHAHAFVLGLRDGSRNAFVAHQRAVLLVGPPCAPVWPASPTRRSAERAAEEARRLRRLQGEDLLGES